MTFHNVIILIKSAFNKDKIAVTRIYSKKKLRMNYPKDRFLYKI